ncbi:DUF4232 domain-containing protein [Streptomyces sp. ET3-23]|uniref:DUF4232 domain-containing protein n=1 Tax=Streptomyces sp. ET3-23 TaxID=2885643 RepID=UPI001D0FDA07|nr:DUF4232 domain-containing protein [Streptomyces sp. ET3-23]MCC2279899.1 DUF4232 domain-containing protein [Streptomyces sp. ET3-23]
MHTAIRPRLPVALAAGAVLLTACGPQGTGPADHEAKRPAASDDAPAQDGVRITSAVKRPRADEPSVATADFTVTNRETEPFTYTITFTVTSLSGAVLESPQETVPSVPPGRTVRRTLRLNPTPGTLHDRKHVRIAKVRRVPSDEAPAATGPCPPSGIRITADEGDAAMGLRVVGLHLTNCGTRSRHLDGPPGLELLDGERKPVPGIDILHDAEDIASGTGFDDPPGPVDLAPGESASAGLVWRNTTGAGTAVNVPYVRIKAGPAFPPVTVTPELDLGTTGRLAVSPWKHAGRAASQQ